VSAAAWLQEQQQAFFTQRCLHAVARLGIADLLVDGPLGAEELARRSDAHPDALRRILRFLVSRGVFEEAAPATYALNARAAMLRSDAPQSARWLFMHDLPARASAAILHSARTGEPAFEHLHGKTVWDHLAENPEENDWFNRHMRAQAVGLALPAVSAYDWTPIRTVVDVGGGTGLLLKALLEAHSHLEGVLVDQPHVIAQAQAGERCRVVAGSFLESIPALGDAYVLSRILHDWDDEQAARILRTVRAAMRAGNRLLVLEMVVPEDARPHASKMLDIAMLVQFGGRERTEAEFRALLAGAALRVERIIPSRGPTSVIEALPA
jgi:hypothetical protein